MRINEVQLGFGRVYQGEHTYVVGDSFPSAYTKAVTTVFPTFIKNDSKLDKTGSDFLVISPIPEQSTLESTDTSGLIAVVTHQKQLKYKFLGFTNEDFEALITRMEQGFNTVFRGKGGAWIQTLYQLNPKAQGIIDGIVESAGKRGDLKSLPSLETTIAWPTHQ